MINSYQAFIYGHTVDQTNRFLDFNEGSGQVTATLKIGEYSFSDFQTEIARAMNAVSSFDYTVTANRTTGIVTITKSSGTFKLLAQTGTHVGVGIFSLLGFSAVDTSYAASQTGSSRSGYIWLPQFKGQDYVSFDHQQSAIDGVVKKSANGRVEAVSFGTQKIMDINFMFINDLDQTANNLIVTDRSGVANAQSFLEYATQKKDLEFIPDRTDMDTYQKVILESTEASADGFGFRLKEEYAKGLPGYYQTGLLKFRLIEV